jgi:hypothetical protein
VARQWPAILFCSVALGACVHGPGNDVAPTTNPATSSPAPSSAIAASPPTDRAPAGANAANRNWNATAQQRVPLQTADVQLYLAVMREAAARVRHPDALDVTAIDATQAWSAALDAAARTHAPLPAPLDETILERSANLTGHMTDVQVAGERGIDVARYEWIRDTIERIVVMHPVGTPCTGDAACNTRIPSPGDNTHPQQLAAADARDRRLLQPHAKEIRALETIVRTAPADDAHTPSATRTTPVASTTRKSSARNTAVHAGATSDDG